MPARDQSTRPVRARHIFLIPLFGLFLASSLAAQTTVRGTVIDKATGAGVPDAKVRFFSPDTGAHEIQSDPAGRYALAVTAGSYYISAEKEGYFRKSAATEPGGRLPMIRIDEGASESVDFELQKYGSIRGRVTGNDGEGAGGVQLTLIPAMPAQDAVISSDDGSFALTKLMPGTYKILARPRSAAELRGNGRLADVLTYYPDVTDAAGASAITLTGGTEASGIDLRLQRAPVYRIAGVVFDADGHPAAGVPVRLQRRLPGSAPTDVAVGKFGDRAMSFYMPMPKVLAPVEQMAESTMTSEDGKFAFAAPEGDWLILADMPLERIAGTREDRVSVADRELSLSKSDEDSIELRLAPTFRFVVRAEIASDRKAAFVPPLILQPLQPGRPAVFGQPDNHAARGGDAGQSITFEHVRPGAYTVTGAELGAPEGLFLASFSVGGQEVLSRPFSITSGAIEGRAIFRRSTGSLRGVIEKGAPATVLVVPAADRPDLPIASVEVKDEKPFTIAGLPPGDYSVIALDRVVPAKFADQAFMSGVTRTATGIRIEDSPVAVTLRVNTWPDPLR